MVIEELVYIWSIGFYVGKYYVTIGAVVCFAAFATVIIWFIRSLAD
jgi:hypothetical protein